MKCVYCQQYSTSVIDSRLSDDGRAIRRRRVCASCKRRFTTYERVEGLDLKVIKKNGTQESYKRDKMMQGILKATWKRPISVDTINRLVDEVETELRTQQSKEIKSWEIGNLLMNRLKKLDHLSYLLFASVYRDFTDINDFLQEIEQIEKERN